MTDQHEDDFIYLTGELLLGAEEALFHPSSLHQKTMLLIKRGGESAEVY